MLCLLNPNFLSRYVSKSCAKVHWVNRRVTDTFLLYDDSRPDLEDLEDTVIEDLSLEDPTMEREIEEDMCLLSVVPVVLIPTKTVPIDFVMLLVSPFHPKHKEIMKGISEKERKGYNNAPVEKKGNDDEGNDEDANGESGDEEDYGTKKVTTVYQKGKGKKKGNPRVAS